MHRPRLLPGPAPVAQNDSLCQRTPTKSAKGCCCELLGNQNREVLASKSVIMLFDILIVLGGGRFRLFMYIVLFYKVYPSLALYLLHIVLGGGRFRPLTYIVLQSTPTILPPCILLQIYTLYMNVFYILFGRDGRFIPCSYVLCTMC